MVSESIQQDGSWRRLWGVSAYRLLIAAAIAVLVQLPFSKSILDIDAHNHPLIVLTLVAAGISLFYILFLLMKFPGQTRWHIWLQVLMDTVLVLLLLRYGGGINGPFSILPFLLLVSVASLLRGRGAFLFVWVLLLLLVLESLQGGMTSVHPLLGQLFIYILALVAVAVLADSLVRSLDRDHRLALQRDQELFNLNVLNREIVEHMDVGVLVLDKHNRVILSNPIARKLSGYRFWGNVPVALDLVQARLAAMLIKNHGNDTEVLVPLGPEDPALRDQTPSLMVRKITLPGSPYRLLLLRDASVLRAMEREAQLAALGRLAANIAHEIRNPLSVIRHTANLLDESMENASSRHLFEILERETVRINAIVESVLEMARPGPAHLEPIALSSWLPKLIVQLQADPQLADMHVLVQDIPMSLLIYADPAQLRQVVWNLLHNTAQYAVDEDGLVRVEISAERYGKEQIMLTLRDFGPGIRPEVMERIFEPFFTTNSRGTGLGLPMVRELIQMNNGQVLCENHPECGAIFKIFLPCWDPHEEAA
ncbi:histidine kinase [Acidithiobacillus thiooxidans]|uniref:two-component system sensor histidine kinase NtrB n=1 Tax=Acidithiobacillus thiooxidans TaxID=930 RepID=UPI001C0686B9|nr:ATP-binding protein [Acidithiobacillus thiooxidans]MBU2834763.1 histidine kinase [Acidithiobacillus thiooxidans]